MTLFLRTHPPIFFLWYFEKTSCFRCWISVVTCSFRSGNIAFPQWRIAFRKIPFGVASFKKRIESPFLSVFKHRLSFFLNFYQYLYISKPLLKFWFHQSVHLKKSESVPRSSFLSFFLVFEISEFVKTGGFGTISSRSMHFWKRW